MLDYRLKSLWKFEGRRLRRRGNGVERRRREFFSQNLERERI
jgi:hypothetical protein